MKAVQIKRFGTADELALVELPPPVPGSGEARVRLELSGVNFIDVYMRDGSYSRSRTYVTPLPMTLGMEGCGTVDAVGAGVEGIAPGDRVAYCLARGSYAEYAVVPVWRLVPVPPGVPSGIATALMLQGSTAHYLTHSAFRIEPGMTCLVHAGAGGVGQLLIQLAKRRGARVLATVGSPEKAELARARGADHCILYREADFREETMRLTDGKGVNVVYDSVGRDTLPKSLRSLGRRGTCVNFGASSGQPEPVAVLDLAEAGSVYLTRPHLADYMANAEEIRARASDLFAAWRSGALVVTIDRELPLSAAQEAHRILESRGTKGKLLLRAV
ncbi:MAG: quinone oxidoreductase [Pseudomonadota bacterium]